MLVTLMTSTEYHTKICREKIVVREPINQPSLTINEWPIINHHEIIPLAPSNTNMFPIDACLATVVFEKESVLCGSAVLSY